MPYNLIRADGNPLLTLADNSIDNTSTSLTFIGKNSLNFGYVFQQNLVYMLQNFASTSSPIRPLIGQLWYDVVVNGLKVFDGNTWNLLVPGYDGAAGAITVTVGSNDITCIISNSVIVSVVSHTYIPSSSLPLTVTINSTNYDLSARFPQGIFSGYNLAQDSNLYQYNGNATTSTKWQNSIVFTMQGDVSGSTSIIGNSNVVINTILSRNFTPGTYTKVVVASNGLVTSGNVSLNSGDIVTALTYTPIGTITINGDITGNAVVNSDGTSTVTASINSNASIIGTIPITAMVLWPGGVLPTNWAICNGQTVTTPNGTFTTPDLSNVAVAGNQWIARTY